MPSLGVAVLLNETFSSVSLNEDKTELRFQKPDGSGFLMHHEQDCCESVWLDDVNGDLEDLIGSPILKAQERTQDKSSGECCESETWTFYAIASAKGQVNLRWVGRSNGYYSESVHIWEIAEGGITKDPWDNEDD